MMHISEGKRNEWEFEYTAFKLADGAVKQMEFRRDRVSFWTQQKANVMAEIKESGLQVDESVTAQISNYSHTQHMEPQIRVRSDLQRKLQECHAKIAEHQQAFDEYKGWIEVLMANPEQRLKLTQADWLYFFGKR